MATEVIDTKMTISYPVADDAIAELQTRYTGLTATTREGYELCKAAIGTCRDLRGSIERTRVELKAESLAWGRKVDAEAKRLTGLLLAIEEPLKASKQAVDDEKDRVRREKEEAERARIAAEEMAKRQAEEARLKAERDAEEARLKVERERLAAEQAALRAEQEKAAAERAVVEAERRKLEAERQAAERAEFERQAKAKAEAEAAEKARRDAEQAELRRLENERLAAEERARIEAMRPDVEKVVGFSAELRSINVPIVKSSAAKRFIGGIASELAALAAKCETFSGKQMGQ